MMYIHLMMQKSIFLNERNDLLMFWKENYMSGRYTYKDELCKRLKVAFPRLNEFKIKRIAQL